MGTPAAGPGAFGVTLLGAQVNVLAPDPGDRAWLREILTPSFGIGCAQHGALTVEIVSTVTPPMPGLTEDVPCYAFETGVYRLPGRVMDGTLHAEHRDWSIRLTVSDRLVQVAPTGFGARVRPAALRVVQELAVAAARVQGAGSLLQLHASCLQWRGGAVAFLGAKEAGKTTTIAHLCASLPAPLIANDKIVVAPDRVIGLPTPVSLRPGSWRQLSERFRTIPDVLRPSDLTLDEYEHAGGEHGQLHTPRFTRLSTPQFARELGVDLSAGAPLRAAIQLEIDPEHAGFDQRRLTPQETIELMHEHSFGLTRSAAERTIFDDMAERGAGGGDRRDSTAEAFAPVTGSRVRLGADFLETEAAARRLIDAVAG